jgi:hypothetical protein
MRNERDEIEYQDFPCSRLDGEIAAVTVTYRVGELSRDDGASEVRAVKGADCDDKKRCGVGVTHGLSTKFEWERCVHPILRRT